MITLVKVFYKKTIFVHVLDPCKRVIYNGFTKRCLQWEGNQSSWRKGERTVCARGYVQDCSAFDGAVHFKFETTAFLIFS